MTTKATTTEDSERNPTHRRKQIAMKEWELLHFRKEQTINQSSIELVSHTQTLTQQKTTKWQESPHTSQY
jgi:hypothetical protein